MLDSETKRRIDTARDILVGKVPDPKSQVEQITIALIYKFMDDMDAEAEELGGVRSFFIGEYQKFSWAKLLSPALGGYEMLSLYTEAVEKMTRNQGIPQLFRDIFKNAYLPYRDPETLKMFLKVINDFNYEHSEKLGDAFEYLLSVLGSQGDAGQFRTPRHIIDFMVKVVDPQKGDSILDPACGTAGFLISAYKHVMAANEKDGKPGGDLKPDERTKLANNIRGYDISPDMVRLSLVNLYLHGFTTPNIFEYDTLTSDERWNEYADVILANPPFMSPKGGIKPHKRFSVQSNRSEVLFVDYMAEHLTPNGRAAIIVPEGIIFQSAGAYKQLRKYLIESNYLWAVVSLPAGVFNPYAGVKTSILFLDKSLAKKSNQILFVKIAADGFDLGAQRRPIDKNDLPQALNVLKAWRSAILAGPIQPIIKRVRDAAASPEQYAIASPTYPVIARDGVLPARSNPPVQVENIPDEGIASSQTTLLAMTNVLAVPIPKLAETGDYNLSANRYLEVLRIGKQTYPMVALGKLCEILDSKRVPIRESERKKGEYPYYGATGILDHVEGYLFDEKLVLVGEDGAKWNKGDKTAFIVEGKYWVNNHAHVLRPKRDVILDEYLVGVLVEMDLRAYITGVTVPKLNQEKLRSIEIPLPPLEIQRQLVDEIAAHQRIIDGARQVVEGWKPNLELELAKSLPEGVDEFKKYTLGEIAELMYGFTASAEKVGDARFIRITDINEDGTLNKDTAKYVNVTDENKVYLLQEGDLLVARTGATYGKTLYFEGNEQSLFASYLIRIRFSKDVVLPKYYWYFARSDDYWTQAKSLMTGGGQPQFKGNALKRIPLYVPPLEIQRAIVTRIERERLIVEGNRELIRLYEEKIKKVIERVWEG